VTVTLKPRDPAGLAKYATDVATPGSSIYRQYLTVAQFRQRFAPTDSEVAAVAAELRGHGLRPGPVSANGLAIRISATAGTLAHAFSTSFQRVELQSGRVAYANTAAPQIPASLAGTVQAVVGLDSLARAVPLGIKSPPASGRVDRVKPRVVTGGPQPCSNAVSDGTTFGAYTADQLASAYRFSDLYGAGDQGAGQTVALFELEPYSASDISTYQSCYGTSTSISNVPVDGFSSTGAGSGEAALDIEDVIGLSQGSNIKVYEGPNTSAGVIDTYNQIVSDNIAKVISTSWGLCEALEGTTDANSENTIFQEASVQGQSVFAAAGDSGSTDCGGHSLAVDDPASQPFVTGVGGTSLSAIGPPPTQSVWNDGTGKNGGGGGGGISSFWTMPTYQSGASGSLNVINTNSSGTPCSASGGADCREVPDVSADADQNTGYVVFFNGSWTAFGGTSAAAPLWAAFTALTNASSGCSGTAVGFANPALYQAAGNAYASDFSDVTSGTNNLSGSGLYPAATGYDMASGLGTPIGSGLPGGLCDITTGIPAVTLTTPASGSATNNTKPSFSGTAGTATGDGSTITVKIYSGSTTSGSLVQTLTTTQSAGSWSVAPSAALAEGTYTARAQQTNTNTSLTGFSAAHTFLIDTTAPANALSLTNKSGGGSYYPGSGTTVYYQGLSAGSFKLQNTVSDSGSGPASSAFGTLGGTTTGWSFTGSTVSSPAGGPYVSNAFAWTAGASSAPTEAVTGADKAGNTKLTTLSFTNDSAAPTGSITYTNGYANTGPISVSFSASDSGSGLNSSAGQLQRASATLSNGSCGTFGAFANVGTTGVSSPYSDTGVSSGNCYQYRYLVPDNVGNQATISSASVLKLDGSAPTNALSLTGNSGGGAFLSGGTLYYQGSTAGSFKLQNAVSDPDSGPASSTFGALGGSTTGWSFTNSTVSSPTGGPYVSNTLSWTGGTTSAPTESVTSADNAGNSSSPTTLTLSNDSTAPTGSVSASQNGSAVSVSFSASDGGGSGVAAAAGQLMRATSSGGCGAFGAFSPVGPVGVSSSYSDTSVTAGNCYEYEYVVSDNVGNQATIGPSAGVPVTTPPPSLVASFTFSPTSPLTAQTVSFDGTASQGSIASYSWNYGDGSTGTGASPTHAYAHAGNYTVSLTVSSGSSSDTTSHTVTVADRPPIASFTFAPSSPLSGQAVAFNANGSSDADGTIASDSWLFGDGSAGSGATPTHTYSQPGAYTVQLSVTDDSGSVAVTTHSVAISAPPSHAPTLNLHVSKQKLGLVLKHGLSLSGSSSQAASAQFQLALSGKDAKRLRLGNGRHAVVIASLKRQLTANKTIAITLQLTSKARKQLANVSSIRLKLTVTATGTGGKTIVSQSLLLKR
jgi:PKD repeat protein